MSSYDDVSYCMECRSSALSCIAALASNLWLKAYAMLIVLTVPKKFNTPSCMEETKHSAACPCIGENKIYKTTAIYQ